MDTKLKKSRPFTAWLAFFIGANLIIASLAGALYLSRYRNDIFASDYKMTQSFKNNIESTFNEIVLPLTDKNYNNDSSWYSFSNILYFGSFQNTNDNKSTKIKTNSDFKTFDEMVSYAQSKPNEYDYLFIWDGSKFYIIQDNNQISPSDDSIYSNLITVYNPAINPNFKNVKVAIAVKNILTIKSGGIYSSYVEWIMLRVGAALVVMSFIAGIALLIISSVKRSSRKEFSRKLAHYSGKLWFEVKVLLSFPVFLVLMGRYISPDGFILFAFFSIWWIYLLLIDLLVNKGNFFTNNSLTYILKFYRSYENKKPFQKAMLLRMLLMVIVEIVLLLIACLSLANRTPVLFFMSIGIGLYLLYRYIKGYTRITTDIGKVVDQIELIGKGDLNTKLVLSDESEFYKTAENLNHLQEGFNRAALEQLRSERMKVELITNVSHDLKTPLTAMVNYIDLLTKEELAPDFANDYVKVLSKKAARLTSLTQDLFDISKAQSGNLELNMESIDIVELINQSLAEFEEKISESGLSFKVSLPHEKIYINADGKKLFRVFDNLISNILKYSLGNTRVYIDLYEDDKTVSLSFKNIAAYEMNINAEELMERFVRGDEARSTEGSGLGLAIVQSFVSLCGGKFEVKIDGDLFKAIVSFNKI